MADNIPQFRRKTSSGYQILQEGNPFQVPDNKLQENITVTPSNERQILHATTPYNGVHEIIVKSVSESETALKKENIRAGVTIFDITGEYGGGGSDLYNGDVTLTTNPQTFNPVGHDGFSSIKVTANISAQGTTSSPYIIPYASSYNKNYVTISNPSSSIGMSQAVIKLHSDLEQYIKKDIKILGITGNYSGESANIQPVTGIILDANQTTINKPSDIDGMSSVSFKLNDNLESIIKSGETILGVQGNYTGNLKELTIDPSTTNSFPITPESGYDGFSKVNFTDTQNVLISSNIIKGVTLFGVEGEYEGQSANLQTLKEVTTNSTTALTITKDSSYDGMVSCKITLNPSLAAAIVKGTSILGVTGTYEDPTVDDSVIYNYGKWNNLYELDGVYSSGSSTVQVNSNEFRMILPGGSAEVMIIKPMINVGKYNYLTVSGNGGGITGQITGLLFMSTSDDYATLKSVTSGSTINDNYGGFYSATYTIPSIIKSSGGYIVIKAHNTAVSANRYISVDHIYLSA